MAFWNERDPILKERYFGVVPSEGNHGEDVKECYFYLDAVPSHSYQRMLYKYPQREFPYARLLEENRRRGSRDPEFELIDSGVFDDGRYFDIVIDVAKESEDAIVFRITAHNRGPDRAPLHLIPQIWFRNTWSWSEYPEETPIIRATERGLLADDSLAAPLAGLLADTRLGPLLLDLPKEAQVLFTDNETNAPRVFGGWAESRSPFTKDAFHRRIVNGEMHAVNPALTGTKACGWLRVEFDPGASYAMHMRLAPAGLVPRTTDHDANQDHRRRSRRQRVRLRLGPAWTPRRSLRDATGAHDPRTSDLQPGGAGLLEFLPIVRGEQCRRSSQAGDDLPGLDDHALRRRSACSGGRRVRRRPRAILRGGHADHRAGEEHHRPPGRSHDAVA